MLARLQAGTENVGICVLEMSNESNAFTGLITVNKATGRVRSCTFSHFYEIAEAVAH